MKKVENADYRLAPFWFLNHKLEKEEIINQVDKMAEMGVGGFVLHSRHGRKTPYLSDEWFEMLGHAVRRADELGMVVWFYDEDNWPSGPAGMKTWEGHPEYIMTYLYHHNTTNIKAGKKVTIKLPENCKIVVCTPVDRNGIPLDFPSGCQVIDAKDTELEWAAPEDKYEKYAVYIYAISDKSKPIFYDNKYLDTLNREAVEHFIKITHCEYSKRYKEFMGKTIKGVFTDEPSSFSGRQNRDVQYTPKLFKEFKKIKGYRLEKCLPALFMPIGEEGEKVRIDYYDVVGKLYSENFYRPIFEWCEKNNIDSIGHMLWEGEMTLHAKNQIDFFQNTKYMHQSGVDSLGLGDAYNHIEEFPLHIGYQAGSGVTIPPLNNLIGPKFASSAAHLLGKKVVDSESFGEIGWSYDLADLKRIFDSQLALGVNYIIPHAFYYSIQGFRKGECPPDESWRIPFCAKHYKKFADYISNACKIFTGGTHLGEIGILIPYRSWWANIIPGDTKIIDKMEKSLAKLSDFISRGCYDWDYLNEDLLIEGRLEQELIEIGPADKPEKFRIIIIPDAKYLKPEAIQKLREAARKGVKVLLLKPDARILKEFKGNENIINLTNLDYKFFNDILPMSNIELEPQAQGKDLVCYSYQKDGNRLFFMFNDGEDPISLKVRFKGEGILCSRDIETLSRKEIGKDNKDWVQICLDSYESKLFEYTEDKRVINRTDMSHSDSKESKKIPFKRTWKISFQPGNAFLLKDWQAGFNVKGSRKIGGWNRFYQKYTSSFNVLHLPSKCILIVDGLVNEHIVGTVNKEFKLSVNGNLIEEFKKGSILDSYMYSADITKSLKPGKNIIEVETGQRFYEGLHIADPMIMIGDFGVSGNSIERPPKNLNTGDWVDQGFPYFAGTISYEQKVDVPSFKKAVIVCEKVMDAVEVIVNGRSAGEICWNPRKLGITEFIKEGRNHFEFKVSNGLANIIGLQKRPAGIIQDPILEIEN